MFQIAAGQEVNFNAVSMLYMSFLVNIPQATTQNGRGAMAGFMNGSGTSILFIGKTTDDGPTLGFGRLMISTFGGAKLFSTNTFPDGEDTLVVAKITTSDVANDTIEASMFPSAWILMGSYQDSPLSGDR